MEALCLLAVLGILGLGLVPLFRMPFGRGPNNLRKLVRPDLAAFLVLTAGVPWLSRSSATSIRSKPPASSSSPSPP
jgi:hypothetical protein